MSLKFFPLAFSLSLAVALAGLACLIWYSAPGGTEWLGCTIQNSSDVAVYFSYLKQGAGGHVLLTNLFAVEPTLPRFDAVWSTLGILSRFGLHPIFIHELTRIIFAAALVFAVYFMAKKIAATERDARLATILCFAGISTGWIHSIYLSIFKLWTPTTYSSPDLMSEFSIGPLLLGGAHAILSLALLMTVLRLAWEAIGDVSWRKSARAALLLCLLLLFHPYFIFVFAVFCLLAVFRSRSRLTMKKIPAVFLPFAISVLPAAAVYLPLYSDKIFYTHHAVVNVLPLAPWAMWLITIMPFVAAFIWRARKKIRLTGKEYWLVAWIASVIICLLLPLPFKRKLTEGLNIALVMLTLPAWIAVRDWIWKKPLRTMNILMSGIFILGASLSPLHLLSSQFTWISVLQDRIWFYRPDELFSAWDYLAKNTAGSSVITADDLWVNVWTPAYSNRITYVAHNHETPDYARKRAEWDRLTSSRDETEVRDLLNKLPITHVIITKPGQDTALIKSLSSEKWSLVFESGTVSIFARTAPSR